MSMNRFQNFCKRILYNSNLNREKYIKNKINYNSRKNNNSINNNSINNNLIIKRNMSTSNYRLNQQYNSNFGRKGPNGPEMIRMFISISVFYIITGRFEGDRPNKHKPLIMT